LALVFGANALVEAILGGTFGFAYLYSGFNIFVPVLAHSMYDFITIMITWWYASREIQQRINEQKVLLNNALLDVEGFDAVSKAVTAKFKMQ